MNAFFNIPTTEVGKYAGLALVGLACALAVESTLSIRYPDYAIRGRRAGNRNRHMQRSLLWPLLMPVVQFFAAYTVHLKLPRVRAQLELWLRQADDPSGLVPSEVLGLSALLGIMLFGIASLQFSWPMAVPALLLGLYLPYDSTRRNAQSRIMLIGRSIPTMADLIVLSMESGMDFIGAVRLLLTKSAVADGKMPVRDELLLFLNQLQLGQTRRTALEKFAERVPAESVRSFTTAVIQAEEKGMPLRDVLRIQAEVLRHKRIQESEAYIANANLQMMAPVMLVIVALLVVIVVPVVTTMDGSLQGNLSP